MHDFGPLFAVAIDSSGWIAIGLFVASVIVSILGWFVVRRETWRDKVDETLEKHGRKFQRIEDIAGIDLDVS
jgi:hypothetical protein